MFEKENVIIRIIKMGIIDIEIFFKMDVDNIISITDIIVRIIINSDKISTYIIEFI